jgi:Coiled stalk of trimeric autotransporter adhesin
MIVGEKIKEVTAGTDSKDAVNFDQLTNLNRRLLGSFPVTVTDGQTSIAIPALYQGKSTYMVYGGIGWLSLMNPTNIDSITTTTITFTDSSWITAGTILVYVYS